MDEQLKLDIALEAAWWDLIFGGGDQNAIGTRIRKLIAAGARFRSKAYPLTPQVRVL